MNLGNNAQVTWKYQTPLVSSSLNFMLYGFSGPGLCSYPKITVSTNEVTVGPFSLICQLYGSDDKKCNKMVKVATTLENRIAITTNTVAIGFEYTHNDQSSNYGEIKALDAEDASNYKGVIIASVYWNNGISYATSEGADISDYLLKEQGWDCNKWVSLISPRRRSDDKLYLELRNHNNLWGAPVSIDPSATEAITKNDGLQFTVGPAGLYQWNPTKSKIEISFNGQLIDNKLINNPYTPIRQTENEFGLIENLSDYDDNYNSFPTSEIEYMEGGIISIYSKPNLTNVNNIFESQKLLYPVYQRQTNMYLKEGILYFR